jgi:hypothetical protein
MNDSNVTKDLLKEIFFDLPAYGLSPHGLSAAYGLSPHDLSAAYGLSPHDLSAARRLMAYQRHMGCCLVGY